MPRVMTNQFPWRVIQAVSTEQWLQAILGCSSVNLGCKNIKKNIETIEDQ